MRSERCVEQTSKNIVKLMEYCKFRHFEGPDLKVLVTFHLFLLHFVNDLLGLGTLRHPRHTRVLKLTTANPDRQA